MCSKWQVRIHKKPRARLLSDTGKCLLKNGFDLSLGFDSIPQGRETLYSSCLPAFKTPIVEKVIECAKVGGKSVLNCMARTDTRKLFGIGLSIVNELESCWRWAKDPKDPSRPTHNTETRSIGEQQKACLDNAKRAFDWFEKQIILT